MKTFVVNPVSGKQVQPKTLARYAQRGGQLLRQFASTKGVDPNDMHKWLPFLDTFAATEFCDWLISRKSGGEIAKSVWRQYQASACALLHKLIQQKHTGVTEADLDRMRTEPCSGAKRNGEKTSGKKQKAMTKAEQAAIDKFLLKEITREAKPGKAKLMYAEPLYHLLHSNVHVALRPAEYAFGWIEGTKLLLRNCKFSDGRSHGEKRTIHLDKLGPDILDSVEKTLHLFRSTYWPTWEARCVELAQDHFNEENPVLDDLDEDQSQRVIARYAEDLMFLNPESLPPWLLITAEDELDRIAEKPVAKLYMALMKNMLKVSSRVFARRTTSPRPTIYSTRHQVTANLKKAGLSGEEIAAILGHRITRTHQVHYATKARGEGQLGLVSGDEADIARVRKFTAGLDILCNNGSAIRWCRNFYNVHPRVYAKTEVVSIAVNRRHDQSQSRLNQTSRHSRK